MKTITVITEQITATTLSVLRTAGVAAVTVTEDRSPRRESVAPERYRGFGNQARLRPGYRIDVVVDDSAVDDVFDSIAIAYGAGFFADAEAWVDTVNDAVLAA